MALARAVARWRLLTAARRKLTLADAHSDVMAARRAVFLWASAAAARVAARATAARKRRAAEAHWAARARGRAFEAWLQWLRRRDAHRADKEAADVLHWRLAGVRGGHAFPQDMSCLASTTNTEHPPLLPPHPSLHTTTTITTAAAAASALTLRLAPFAPCAPPFSRATRWTLRLTCCGSSAP